MKLNVKWKRPSILTLNIVSTVLIVMVGIVYIGQVNRSSTTAFEMKDLQKQIANLRVQNDQLSYRIDEQRSVDRVTKSLKMLGMVEVDQVMYSGGMSSVALNR